MLRDKDAEKEGRKNALAERTDKRNIGERERKRQLTLARRFGGVEFFPCARFHARGFSPLLVLFCACGAFARLYRLPVPGGGTCGGVRVCVRVGVRVWVWRRRTLVKVEVHSDQADKRLMRVVFFTNAPVAAGEELTWSYGKTYGQKTDQACFCGAKECTKFMP